MASLRLAVLGVVVYAAIAGAPPAAAPDPQRVRFRYEDPRLRTP